MNKCKYLMPIGICSKKKSYCSEYCPINKSDNLNKYKVIKDILLTVGKWKRGKIIDQATSQLSALFEKEIAPIKSLIVVSPDGTNIIKTEDILTKIKALELQLYELRITRKRDIIELQNKELQLAKALKGLEKIANDDIHSWHSNIAKSTLTEIGG